MVCVPPLLITGTATAIDMPFSDSRSLPILVSEELNFQLNLLRL
jgi:hypothetical protein